MVNYLEYTHTDTIITTVTDFINQPFSIAANYIGRESDFLSYDGGTGISNNDRITSLYKQDTPQGTLLQNTKLLIKVDESNREVVEIFGKGQVLEQNDFMAFTATHLVRLITDKKYIKSEKYNIFQNFTVLESYPTISVWIWSRALNKIINVTSYVQSLGTKMSKGGGAFSIDLSPITILESYNEYNGRNDVNESNLYVNEKRQTRNNFYFHKNLQANDVVFIKFEELELSKENRKNQGFEIDKSALPNQIYDMIGLIDNNRQSINPANNDVTISINGRDLTKLLIEDSDYFIPLLFTQDATEFYMNNTGSDAIKNRNFVSGTYRALFSYSYRKISDSIQFIINQCAHLGVIPQSLDLFASYGNRRSEKYIVDEKNTKADIETFKAIYQNKSTLNTTKDSNLFKIKEASLTAKEKSQLINSKKVISDWDKYYSPSTEPHLGLWQIIKLEIDHQLDDRRIVDFSISQPDGNLQGCISKICQEPFVEFFGDTYGDMYTFIVRQPPYTKSQILKYLDGTITYEDAKGELNGMNTIIEINDEDILNEIMQFDDAEAFCWYQIMPKELNIMNNNAILAYFPVVFLPEYAEIWGNRRLEIVNNYASYEAIRDKKQDVNIDNFVKSAANDFKYIIESTMYLPFTRKGSITINGDRRIKIGTWIRHTGTGEVFYVNDVQNDFSISNSSIDRTTTLEVNRGMVEKYVRGLDEVVYDNQGNAKLKKISYFDLIDTELIKQSIVNKSITADSETVKAHDKIKTNFGVDKDIFNFFIQRRQFK